MQKAFIKFYRVLIFSAMCINVYGQHYTLKNNWWPVQAVPETIYVCKFDKTDANLAQSLSGVIAQSLNQGLTKDGIWLDTNVEGYRSYLNQLVSRIGIKTKLEELTVWELLKKYSNNNLIKGYVLYNQEIGSSSVNLATIKCGILKAVLINESQELKAKSLGIRKLADVSNANQITVDDFKELAPYLNRNLLVLANPKAPNNRDYAIAHKAMVYYGVDTLLNKILEWMEPLSPVVGWNEGPEYNHIAPCSKWGMINTASDWCLNLPLISCVSDDIKKVKSVDLKTINWNEKKNFHSFVMSDGDNLQWSFSNFIFSHEYWSNQYNTELAMSFTTCAVNLSMVAPDVWATIVSKQAKNTGVIEYGGGYYYPDLFGVNLNSENMLRNLARIINCRMKLTGVKVFGFICKDVNSESSKKAYQIFAEEIDSLVGMVAVQYAPYNGGQGKIFWVKNKHSESIPVMTAKYQVWSDLNIPGSGNPALISEMISRDGESNRSSYGWTIVHAWSGFAKINENEVIDSKSAKTVGVRGVMPIKWAKWKLHQDVKLVTIDELLWRIRMEKYPEETRKYIQND